MKKILLCCFLAFFAQISVAQDCDEKLKIARATKASGNLRLALKQFQAAKGDCKEDLGDDIEKEIFDIFEKIDSLKGVAEYDRRKAQSALLYAINAKAAETKSRVEAERSRQIAAEALDSIRILLGTVQTLIAKGRELQNTFADSSTAQYLYKTAIQHFNYDTITQTRDYQNALTYFALARFLQPSDTLAHFVRASQHGIYAEQRFIAGDLDSARFHYDSVLFFLRAIPWESKFERKRLGQIAHVDSLFRSFKTKYREGQDVVDLKGDWWTLPEKMADYQAVKNIRFVDNQFNFNHLPGVLTQMPNVVSVTFDQCINLRILKNWSHLPNLKQLIVRNNQNLYALNNLDQLPTLQRLTIDNCPALTWVEGCCELRFFETRTSPQVRLARLLQENNNLLELRLADLRDDTIRINNLKLLEILSLSRMRTSRLDGLDQNTHLKSLAIDQLSNLTYFAPPVQLQSVRINNCDSLSSITNWKPSDQLTEIYLYENNKLHQMPDWRNYPNLKTLLIQNDNELKRIYGTKSLREAEHIYIINNPDLITNSVHVGFGFEWGVNVSSVKLEYEHRRRTSFSRLNRDRLADLGFKAVAAYAWKDFDYITPAPRRTSEGYLAGAVINYYSPLWVYTGAGLGVGRFTSRFSDNTSTSSTHLVWINNLGAQFAPPFLKKDKMSINMDLYTVFVKRDYYILPSFGLTYYHTLGMHRNAHFIRKGDARRYIWVDGKKREIGKI